MTQIAYGVCMDATGSASDGAGGFWESPSSLLLPTQDPEIRVDLEHGPVVGQVLFLEKRKGDVWVVAEIADSVCPVVEWRDGPEIHRERTPMYFSIAAIGGPDYGLALVSVSLTQWPARVAARPVRFRPGNVYQAVCSSSDMFEKELLLRAREDHLTRHGGPIRVHDVDADLALERLNRADNTTRMVALDDLHWQRKLERRPSTILGVH
jgi:hypothetical protein